MRKQRYVTHPDLAEGPGGVVHQFTPGGLLKEFDVILPPGACVRFGEFELRVDEVGIAHIDDTGATTTHEAIIRSTRRGEVVGRIGDKGIVAWADPVRKDRGPRATVDHAYGRPMVAFHLGESEDDGS
jgi:hypothetical protein